MRNELWLHEELILVALDPATNRLPASVDLTPVLAGALLGELVQHGRIRIEQRGRSRHLVVARTSLLGEPLLDQTLDRIRTARRPASFASWLQKIRYTPRLTRSILERLYMRSVIRREERTFLGIFRRVAYPVVDTGLRDDVRARLRRCVQDSGAATERDVALFVLLRKVGLLDRVFNAAERKVFRASIKAVGAVKKDSTDAMAVLRAAIAAAGLFLVLAPLVPRGLAAQAAVREQLIGTWRFVALEDWNDQGEVSRVYGERPSGYLIYDRSGRMSVQLMGTCSTGAARTAQNCGGYTAYFGRYTVDGAKNVVVHHVEGALQPMEDNEPRPFRLSGDSLIFGVEKRWRRVFLRVR